MSSNPIPIIIVGPESWQSFGILNPNAVPDDLGPDVDVRRDVMACADKLALVSYSIRIIQNEIHTDLNRFINILNNGDDFKHFKPNPKKPAVAIYHNMSFQAGVQSFFITTKSMLDIYARIISKLIQPKSTLFGFGKAKVGEKKIVGGTVLNWIEHNAPKSYTNKETLIETLSAHIDNWISDVVKYRDEIVHEGKLDGLIEMCIPLENEPQKIRKDEAILPAILGKGDLLEYCQQVQKDISKMLKETLVLLPGINTELLAL